MSLKCQRSLKPLQDTIHVALAAYNLQAYEACLELSLGTLSSNGLASTRCTPASARVRRFASLARLRLERGCSRGLAESVLKRNRITRSLVSIASTSIL